MVVWHLNDDKQNETVLHRVLEKRPTFGSLIDQPILIISALQYVVSIRFCG